MNDSERQTLIKQLIRYAGISDGAKVTFLEFLLHFWVGDTKLPSYSDLCKIRGVARSTIQLHIEELEKSKLLLSVRLPDNRKRYTLNSFVLGIAPKKQVVISKPCGKYHTHELVKYFYFKLKEMGGDMMNASKQDYVLMKELHLQYGAATVVAKIDRFKELYRKNHWGSFCIKSFADHILDIQ